MVRTGRITGIPHQPDAPGFGIDGAGRQAECVAGGVVLKGSVGAEFLGIDHDGCAAVVQAAGVVCVVIPAAGLLQPVHHLHKLVAADFVRLAEQAFAVFVRLVRADDQRHGILCGAGAVVETPFIEDGGLSLQNLIKCALLIRIELGCIGALGGGERHAGDVYAGILPEQLNLPFLGRCMPIGHLALIRLRIRTGPCLPLFKADVLDPACDDLFGGTC